MKCVIFLALIYGIFAVPVEDKALEEFVTGNHKFTAGVYKELLKKESGNFLVSPISAEIILALTNEGAKGDTSAELTTGLSLPSTKENTQKAVRSLLPKLKKSDDDTKLLTANKVYIGDGLKLEDSFKTVATDIYNSEVENVNFANNVAAAAKINGWVEDHTNKKIKNLVSSDAIGESTRIVLVNALYFSGKWVSEFEEYSTYKQKFYKTKSDAVEIPTMHQTEYFNYYENPTLKAKFLELPYKGGELSMVIVLPNEIEGLSSLEQNIEQVFTPQPYERKRVNVALPTFTTETQIDFNEILQALGVKKLFGSADLSGLSSTDKNLAVSQVVQKTFINVTEGGTEAAAATAVGLVEQSLRIDKSLIYDFHADHSFLYFIKLKDTVLFTGRFAKPTA